MQEKLPAFYFSLTASTLHVDCELKTNDTHMFPDCEYTFRNSFFTEQMHAENFVFCKTHAYGPNTKNGRKIVRFYF